MHTAYTRSVYSCGPSHSAFYFFSIARYLESIAVWDLWRCVLQALVMWKKWKLYWVCQMMHEYWLWLLLKSLSCLYLTSVTSLFSVGILLNHHSPQIVSDAITFFTMQKKVIPLKCWLVQLLFVSVCSCVRVCVCVWKDNTSAGKSAGYTSLTTLVFLVLFWDRVSLYVAMTLNL